MISMLSSTFNPHTNDCSETPLSVFMGAASPESFSNPSTDDAVRDSNPVLPNEDIRFYKKHMIRFDGENGKATAGTSTVGSLHWFSLRCS